MSERDLEEKIKVYNFEALKGSIQVNPVFRGAVKTFRKLANSNPNTFKELNETYREEEADKRDDLGIINMTPEQLLDSIIQDINALPREKRKKYLDALANIQERKRAIDAMMLQMAQQRISTPAPVNETKLLVESGQISSKQVQDITAAVKTSQQEMAQRLATGWEALSEGLDKMQTKRTLQ